MPVSWSNLSELLRLRGVRPSYIRIMILRYLLEKKVSHPSAEEIYEELKKHIPTLSKASVYNTLAVLVQAGILRPLTIEKNETRYDVAFSEHGHFQCEVCKKVYDFTFTFESLRCEGLEHFLVKARDFYLRGICPACQKGGKEHGASWEDTTSW
ncbi:MAG: transcriptional repressor [Candidatus Caldatribacterium sp.]|uniref:Fur family transcriptional regulator n=1 Tax=Candidatus Caldatribacterium sp. TaxID=2282143 RepID=UPI0029956B15|nr:transcriptional repressor [Candidatus Caldatribacterium sp.]MCX7730705.1 transcriptional repressor [Candidatus Caldatribacterium sp.]MDW8080327.1 Fur family transcriptional regulator [Candidatus Calescibacterium sp.]